MFRMKGRSAWKERSWTRGTVVRAPVDQDSVDQHFAVFTKAEDDAFQRHSSTIGLHLTWQFRELELFRWSIVSYHDRCYEFPMHVDEFTLLRFRCASQMIHPRWTWNVKAELFVTVYLFDNRILLIFKISATEVMNVALKYRKSEGNLLRTNHRFSSSKNRDWLHFVHCSLWIKCRRKLSLHLSL